MSADFAGFTLDFGIFWVKNLARLSGEPFTLYIVCFLGWGVKSIKKERPPLEIVSFIGRPRGFGLHACEAQGWKTGRWQDGFANAGCVMCLLFCVGTNSTQLEKTCT